MLLRRILGCLCLFPASLVMAHPYTPLACGAAAAIADTVSYVVPGPSGETRDIDIEIVTPTGLPTSVLAPQPAVILSHGGGKGGEPGLMAPWRTALVEACYVGVSIGHKWPEDPVAESLCEDVLDLEWNVDCGPLIYPLLNLLRPYDIAAVIDHLEARYGAVVDPERIAVGGHSAGSAGAMMVAGATRGFATGDSGEGYIDVRDLSDPRPAAFLLFSPQGPGREGFFESSDRGPQTSWDSVTRPVYLATGDGDNGCDDASVPAPDASTVYFCKKGPTPSNRRAVFDLMPANPGGTASKYLFYIDDWRARHSVINLKSKTCESGGGDTPDHLCDLMHEGLRRSAVGFLDWHLRGNPDAEHFLSLDANIPGSQGRFLWFFK